MLALLYLQVALSYFGEERVWLEFEGSMKILHRPASINLDPSLL